MALSKFSKPNWNIAVVAKTVVILTIISTMNKKAFKNWHHHLCPIWPKKFKMFCCLQKLANGDTILMQIGPGIKNFQLNVKVERSFNKNNKPTNQNFTTFHIVFTVMLLSLIDVCWIFYTDNVLYIILSFYLRFVFILIMMTILKLIPLTKSETWKKHILRE